MASSAEIQSNIKDIRNKVIREGDIDLIATQTGIQDKLHIERTLMECENDISRTILSLLNAPKVNEVVKEPTVFDEIRTILNEKDKIYFEVMTNGRR
jgi:hypothetical protein